MARLILSVAAVIFLGHAPGAQGDPSDVDPLREISERLRNRIEAGEALAEIVACGELIYCSYAVPTFYERRSFRPAWVNESGPLPHCGDLLQAVEEAELEGLTSDDYHLLAARETLKLLESQRGFVRAPRLGMLVDLELLLTDTFLVYGAHLLAGRVDPESIDPEWHAMRRDADMPQLLEDAIASGEIRAGLRGLLPPQPGYRELRDALKTYREIRDRGGWPMVDGTHKLEKGYSGLEVVSLRARLSVTGDMEPWVSEGPEVFDESLERGVMRFQRRHGLDEDGVVGPATRAALNVPVEERIELIILNMERHRWLPQDLGEHHVLVNIADFTLGTFEDGLLHSQMRVVVGRDYRRTPVFSDLMTYLVLNPYWHIPPSIAIKDIIPSVRKDPAYFADKKIRVFEGWGVDAKEIDPEDIDWWTIDAVRCKYRFRQDPGPENSLGRIKFMFPNKFHVYLHDTPARDLFDRTERTFSSGCIRVEKPIELALFLLHGDAGWTREKLLARMDQWREETVLLPASVPIHLLYWTAFVDEEGAVHFRNDVYNRDQRLRRALHEQPPGPGEGRDGDHPSPD